MEWITGILTVITGKMALSAGAGVALTWILKKIPNDKIKRFFADTLGNAGFALGKVLTLGLNKWKYTNPLWEKILEPYFADLIKNLAYGVQVFFVKIIEGLDSDDKKDA